MRELSISESTLCKDGNGFFGHLLHNESIRE